MLITGQPFRGCRLDRSMGPLACGSESFVFRWIRLRAESGSSATGSSPRRGGRALPVAPEQKEKGSSARRAVLVADLSERT